jgi:hypothetical protein
MRISSAGCSHERFSPKGRIGIRSDEKGNWHQGTSEAGKMSIFGINLPY